MKTILFQDFNNRSKEVSKYFIFLKNLEQSTARLSLYDVNGNNKKNKHIDEDLLKTLKASAFLLLYNLVESTMRNAIEAIFDELQINRISYDEIRPELKKIVLKNINKRNPKKLCSEINKIAVDIITVGFEKDDLFSGNIDARKIRDTADEYGFSYQTDYEKTANGIYLLTVKENRNDLAHGLKSFTEVGRDKTADELLEIKNKVVSYLRQILINVDQYIASQDYLDEEEYFLQ